jgi:hypothetical protein
VDPSIFRNMQLNANCCIKLRTHKCPESRDETNDTTGDATSTTDCNIKILDLKIYFCPVVLVTIKEFFVAVTTPATA